MKTTIGAASFVRAMAPVVSREGPTGTLVLEVTTERVDAERSAIQRTALGVGLAALALGFAAAWIIGRSIGRRIEAIAGATRAVAGGDRTVRSGEDGSADEVGQLARSFNTMFTPEPPGYWSTRSAIRGPERPSDSTSS